LVIVGSPSNGQFLPVLTNLLRTSFGLLMLALAVGAFPGAFGPRWGPNQRAREKIIDLDAVRALTWSEFRARCSESFARLGYTVEQEPAGSTDDAVSLVLRRDGEVSLVQCRRWRSPNIGIKEVRELYEAVAARNADRGIFVASGSFSGPAMEFAIKKPLVLIDGAALARLFLEWMPKTASAEHASIAAQTPNSIKRLTGPRSGIGLNNKDRRPSPHRDESTHRQHPGIAFGPGPHLHGPDGGVKF
jgi:restriction system protein